MARRTPSTKSKLKAGRGKGHGRDYKPFLTVRDVPSKGLRSRPKGWKTGREHHLLSNDEKRYFYILEWAHSVVDIREQFPLPLEETMEIAQRLDIKHPTNPHTKELAVITTDFLVDEVVDGRNVVKARTVKPAEKLNDKRVIEKLEIERTYWHEKGIDWGIVVDEEVVRELTENVEWIHDALDSELSPSFSTALLPQIEQALYEAIEAQPDLPLSHAALGVDHDLGLKSGTCLWAVRHFIATRHWAVNMFSRIRPDEPLKVERQTSDLKGA